MQDLLDKLSRARLIILATFLILAGLTLLVAAQMFRSGGFGKLPVADIGSGLFTTGLVTILLDWVVGKINEQRQTEQLRSVLKEQASVMRDAVIEGFAFNPDDLARVSTPETLDRIIQNGLGIPLGDQVFADELYTDIRDQAVRSVERWHDAKINIRLSMDRRATGGSAPAAFTGDATSQPERLVVTIRHEYTVIPSSQTRRFASVSDPAEYRELVEDGGSTFVWFAMEPRPAMLKLLAYGSGAVDCVYHVALPELLRTATVLEKRKKTRPAMQQRANLELMVTQGRLRSYSDLIAEVARLPANV